MKKRVLSFLFIITLFSLTAVSASAVVNDTLKVGIRWGDTALEAANLENAVGSVYEFGYYDEDREFVYLDVTHKPADAIRSHFPNIYEKCLSIGIDITKDWIPVTPAAHYCCGGVKVDTNGETSIKRLYALGETSCTGLHGANRLASNSLIEAVVYADQAARHASSLLDRVEIQEGIPDWDFEGTQHTEEMLMIIQSKREMQTLMSNYVGIVRSNLSLKRAMRRLEILWQETEELYNKTKPNRELCELRNMIAVAYLVIKQGREIKESVGCHYNADYPKEN